MVGAQTSINNQLNATAATATDTATIAATITTTIKEGGGCGNIGGGSAALVARARHHD